MATVVVSVVVEAIVTALQGVCDEVHADETPGPVSTDTMHHLGSRVTGALALEKGNASG